jgi:hypothetical protein
MRIAVLIVLVLAAGMAGRLFWAWLSWRGRRMVTCPETKQPAGVAIDVKHVVKHAAWTPLGRPPDLRLEICSRWPERQGCGQECLTQIEAAPEGCLVRNILGGWYAGKRCAVCGNEIGEIHWADHKPALLSPDGLTVEWEQVPTERIPDVLQTHAPVCWNCHIVQTFCHNHPELVVDRARSSRL